MAYNFNPAPQSGQGAFGTVPGPIGVPSPSADLSAIYPNLSGTTAAASAALMNELTGQLSPATIRAIQDAAATYGVTSGMPGSGLSQNRFARDLGLATEDLQRKGLQDYSSLIPTVSATQTVPPALQTEIASANALNRSAPSPAAAQSYALDLFNRYLATLRGPQAGTGTRVSNPNERTPWQEDPLIAQLGPGTVRTGPGTYHTPYLGF
jgi:hypothetical protein